MKSSQVQFSPIRVVLFFSSLLIAESSVIAGEVTIREEFQPVVAGGLAYIAKDGQSWIDKRKCVTCHQVTYMLWSNREAQNAGFKINEKKLDEWTTWSHDWKSWFKEERNLSEEESFATHPDTLAHLILSKTAPDDSKDWKQRYLQSILDAQLENGLWKAGGQLPQQKRPPLETQEVTTMWNLLAILESGAQSLKTKASLEQGFQALGKVEAGVSTEWWATRYIIERKLGPPNKAHTFLQGLLERQREDGGWGWLCEEESDAFGTGLALFALSHADQDLSESIRKGQMFLKQSQQDGGGWKVKSTLKRSRDRFRSHTSVWGTSWAVIGLSRTLSLEEK